ncbi:hypothetical protein HJC23_000120 [Cyclotella cryptica]|uniref:Uncharacterized protein n=1 Tax=Cyclotella cryptica TaxID=29204 RepID=A0ABD3NXR1_9STRA
MEWTFGITDAPPRKWKNLESRPRPPIPSSLDVMSKLCDTAIRSRREYDHGMNEHLWDMKISSFEDAMNPPNVYRMYDGHDDESGEDVDEAKYRGLIEIRCPASENHVGFDDDPDSEKVSSKSRLSLELLPVDSMIVVTYDYGTTTTLYLKVLRVKSQAVRKLLQYFTLKSDTDAMTVALNSVPAYHLPKEQQVDFFPNASKAFLGYYVRLFHESDCSDVNPQNDMGVDRKVMGCVTVGLASKNLFCSMESRDQSTDLLYTSYLFDPT